MQMGLKLPFHHFVLGDRLIKPIQVVGVYKFWVVGFKYVFNVDPYLGKISNLIRWVETNQPVFIYPLKGFLS